MRKIVLILIAGLVVALNGPGVARAGGYAILQHNQLFSAIGTQTKETNSCSVDDFCLCSVNLKDTNTLFENEDIFYSGNFKKSSSPFNLYSVNTILTDNTGDLLAPLGSEGVIQVNLKVDTNNHDCPFENKIMQEGLSIGPNTMLPKLNCQYIIANGYGCCCANNPDGSVKCEVTAKDQSSCTLTCPDPTYSKFEAEGGDCSSHEKKAYTSTSTAGVDLNSIRAEAALQLNPMKWLTGSPTGKINQLIGMAIKFLMMAIGSLLLLFYVYAGFLWMTAQGNAEAITKAKTILFWSTLAIVVQLFAGILVSSVFGLLTTG